MRASACCSWAVCRRSKQRLDHPDIPAALEKMSGEAVAQCMQAHALFDPGRLGRCMEQPAQLAGSHRLSGFLSAGKQPAFLRRYSGIETQWAHLPPLPQEVVHLGREHDIAILAALGLLDANDLLRAVDMLNLQPHDLAGTQAAAIAEAEQDADLEAAADS